MNLRFNDFAMALAIDVLPTPGGPIKQSIGPRRFGFNIFIAMNCNNLFFTFSMPKWFNFNTYKDI